MYIIHNCNFTCVQDGTGGSPVMPKMSSEDNIPVPNQMLEVRPEFDYA